jgi:hypothetical protein
MNRFMELSELDGRSRCAPGGCEVISMHSAPVLAQAADSPGQKEMVVDKSMSHDLHFDWRQILQYLRFNR